VDRVVKPAGIDVDLHIVEMTGRLPAEIETVAFRILQEAVTNTLRHARATRVEIRLDRRDHLLIVMVRDDGSGFDPEAPATGRGRLGLHGMRERAQLIGGTLQIMGVPGVGTTVVARLPLPQDPSQGGPS
jgi:two-component system sensor histidine kinase UhpB